MFTHDYNVSMQTIFLLLGLFGSFFDLFMLGAWIIQARSNKQVQAIVQVGSQGLASVPLDGEVR